MSDVNRPLLPPPVSRGVERNELFPRLATRRVRIMEPVKFAGRLFGRAAAMGVWKSRCPQNDVPPFPMSLANGA